MAKSIMDNACIDFRNQMDMLMNIKGYTREDLAKVLDVDPNTITRARKDPTKTSGRVILLVQGMLKKAERDRWD